MPKIVRSISLDEQTAPIAEEKSKMVAGYLSNNQLNFYGVLHLAEIFQTVIQPLDQLQKEKVENLSQT